MSRRTRVLVALVAGLLAFGSVFYRERFDLAVWYMQGSRKTQESALLLMLEYARPIIEKDCKMSLPEKILGGVTGKRNEDQRQADALKDVRSFGESGFSDHRLHFKNVHNVGLVGGVDVSGFDFALDWKHGDNDEVLAAFNANLLTREIGKMRINESCGFFTDLRSYVEARARKN